MVQFQEASFGEVACSSVRQQPEMTVRNATGTTKDAHLSGNLERKAQGEQSVPNLETRMSILALKSQHLPGSVSLLAKTEVRYQSMRKIMQFRSAKIVLGDARVIKAQILPKGKDHQQDIFT